MKYLLLAILGTVFLPTFVSAHPGDLDAYGYHTCWLGYYECAQYGVLYGIPHYHGLKTYSNFSGTPLTDEEYYDLMLGIYKDKPGFKKVANGFMVEDRLYCKASTKKDKNKCIKEKKKTKLKAKSNSMSDPSRNERVRFTNNLKAKKWLLLDDFTDKQWVLYKKEVLEYVPKSEIKKYAPDWFIKDNKIY